MLNIIGILALLEIFILRSDGVMYCFEFNNNMWDVVR